MHKLVGMPLTSILDMPVLLLLCVVLCFLRKHSQEYV